MTVKRKLEQYTNTLAIVLLVVVSFESMMVSGDNQKKSRAAGEKNKGKYEFFTSASDMEVLLTVETKLAKKFLRYVKKEEERLDQLEEKIREIENARPQAGRESIWISHVTNSYTVLKRMASFWPRIGDYYSKSNTTKDYMLRLFADLSRIKEALPAEEDMRGALAAVFRLQDTYNLNAADFIDGLGPYAHQLNVEEIFEIGYLCIGLHDHYHGQQWFKEALKRFPVGIEQVGFLDRISLLEYLAWSEYHLGNLEEAITLTEQIVHLDPTHRSAPINLELYQEDLKMSLSDPNVRKKVYRRERDWQNHHDKLCSGQEKMEQEIINRLYCKYEHNTHPRFILKPLKYELAYDKDPKIVIYHDFLRDREMEAIKNKARPMLRRATVHDPKTGELVFADYRVSKSAWLKPEMDEIVHEVIAKVGDVTGLDMRYSESLQIANYGLAGQYEPHYDHSTIKVPKHFADYGGNRIATMLMYMSEVERGGSTIFVSTGPGVAIKPEKGSGVFWYNLKQNGEGDKKTRHAACPVLLGHKWVSNLWIHEHGQEFRRPCSLNKDE